jgi:hypothetical protein
MIKEDGETPTVRSFIRMLNKYVVKVWTECNWTIYVIQV